jgi:hypothetical protein
MQGSFAFASCTALSSLLKPALRLYAHSHHNTSRSCSPAYDMHCQSPRSSRGVKLVAFCSRIRWEETMLRSKSRRQAAVSSVRYTGCPCCNRRRLAGSSIDFDDSVGVLNVVAVTELRSMVTASQAPQGSEPDCCGAAFLVDVEEAVTSKASCRRRVSFRSVSSRHARHVQEKVQTAVGRNTAMHGRVVLKA